MPAYTKQCHSQHWLPYIFLHLATPDFPQISNLDICAYINITHNLIFSQAHPSFTTSTLSIPKPHPHQISHKFQTWPYQIFHKFQTWPHQISHKFQTWPHQISHKFQNGFVLTSISPITLSPLKYIQALLPPPSPFRNPTPHQISHKFQIWILVLTSMSPTTLSSLKHNYSTLPPPSRFPDPPHTKFPTNFKLRFWSLDQYHPQPYLLSSIIIYFTFTLSVPRPPHTRFHTNFKLRFWSLHQYHPRPYLLSSTTTLHYLHPLGFEDPPTPDFLCLFTFIFVKLKLTSFYKYILI
jgi:hypothetical protein